MKKFIVVFFNVICFLALLPVAACGGESGGSNISTAYTVTVSVSETGYGTVDIDKIENVTLDTAITVNGNKLTVGETVITATASEKTAQYTYAFDKWIAAEKVTGDITVTALFTRTVNKYTVTFETDGGSAIDPIQVDYGTPVSALDNLSVTPPKNCHLDKWQKKTGVDIYEDFPNDAILIEDVTVKAVWAINDSYIKGLNILSASASWGSHYHGTFGGVNSSEESITVTANKSPYSNFRGFVLLPSAIQALYDLGIDKLSFKVTTEADGFVNIYFSQDSGLDYLEGEPAGKDGTDYYYASGTTVTIDLVALIFGNSTFINGDGLKFVITSAPSWVSYNANTFVTFSEIGFAAVAPDQKGFNVLSGGGNYVSHYHGTVGTVSADATASTINVAVSKGPYGNSGCGFRLRRSAIQTLYNLGIDEISFKVTVGTGGYIGVYVTGSGNSDYISGFINKEMVDVVPVSPVYYFASGATVTINVAGLIGCSSFMNNTGDGGGLKFIVTSAASWEISVAATSITLSDMTFTEFTWENSNKLKLATTTGDFDGSDYDTGHLRTGYLADDKVMLDLVYQAGFKYVDFNMYSFTMGCDYMQSDWKSKIAELKDYADSLGLTFVQAHSQGGNPLTDNQSEYDALVTYTLRQIEICGELGIENIVVHPGCKVGYTKQQWFDANKAFFDTLLVKAAECGVNVLCENSTAVNRGVGVYWADSGADMREFIEYVNDSYFHGCWDTGHGNCEGAQYDDILALGDELYAIHFNDNMGNADTHLIPYFGTLDSVSVLRALSEIGFDGYFTFESTGTTRTNNNWHGPDDLPILSEKTVSQLSGDRLGQEKLLYQIGVKLLSTYGMLDD